MPMTSAPTVLAPMSSVDKTALADLGSVLRLVGYADGPAPERGTDPALLFGVFARNATVPLARMKQLVGDQIITMLVGLGIGAAEHDSFRMWSRISLWRGLLLAGDPGGLWEVSANSVPAVSGATEVLADLVAHRPVGIVFDIGCGAGALALLTARHAQSVIATDVNPRALAYSNINAALNGVTNVTTRQGSLFEPVENECADLIVANLPFVISPDQDFLFRDGDRPSEALVEETASAVRSHLSPQGVAQILCNWLDDTEHPDAGPAHLADISGCDVLALRFVSRSPLEHTRNWHNPLDQVDHEAFTEIADRWVRWFESRKVESIAFGSLAFRHSVGPTPSYTFHHAPGPRTINGGQHVRRLFLASTNPDGWNEPGAIPKLVPISVHQQLTFDGNDFAAQRLQIIAADSAGVVSDAPAEAVHVLFEMDGSTSSRTIVDHHSESPSFLQSLWLSGMIEIVSS